MNHKMCHGVFVARMNQQLHVSSSHDADVILSSRNIREFIHPPLTNTISIDFAVWLSEKFLSIIQLFTVLRKTRTFESRNKVFS
jgi:hypothetical protein